MSIEIVNFGVDPDDAEQSLLAEIRDNQVEILAELVKHTVVLEMGVDPQD